MPSRSTRGCGFREGATEVRPISEGTVAAAALALIECPLDASWRDWDAMVPPIFSILPAADRVTCETARHLTPLRQLGLIRLPWVGATSLTTPEGRRSSRTHATADVDGHKVHVDWVSNSSGGPGRSFAEFRVFINGHIAGRGGDWGCSLGAVGRDLPLVARIGADAAITLDYLWRGLPIVEVWEVDVSRRERDGCHAEGWHHCRPRPDRFAEPLEFLERERSWFVTHGRRLSNANPLFRPGPRLAGTLRT